MSEEQAYYETSNLKKVRRDANVWTQRELAERTGIAPNIISDLECGRRMMSPGWAKRIAEVLEIESGILYKYDVTKI